jgi:hypothetical protein
MSLRELRQSLPARPLTPEEDRDLQLRLGRSLTYAERFAWLCRTVAELRPFLGRARQPAAEAPQEPEKEA